MSAVFLVGCGKVKAKVPCSARGMYMSPLFQKSIEVAENLSDDVFIISAAKGLLTPDEMVTPYDVDLGSWDIEARRDWGRSVVAELERAVSTFSRVVIFAGKTYADPIVEEMGPSWRPFLPLAGLEIGERLSFLNRMLRRAA